ncbi:hypothetical protein P7K49_003240, partial [Saguinus oedipus]
MSQVVSAWLPGSAGDHWCRYPGVSTRGWLRLHTRRSALCTRQPSVAPRGLGRNLQAGGLGG